MTLVLGLESSCDETAAAVVDHTGRVLSNVIASQHDLHAEYGGVVPEIASRAHVERISPVVEQALQQAGVTGTNIDAVAVGHRPGLVGSLVVAVSGAKALAWAWGVPIVGVDHVHAHLAVASLSVPGNDAAAVAYPSIGLVVSGGHTSLYSVESPLVMHRLGATIDDAAGEAFDKAAVMLGLGFPGGPAIDRAARQGQVAADALPLPKVGADAPLSFSFSGLKTALLYAVRGQPRRVDGKVTFERDFGDMPEQQRNDLAATFEHVVVHTLIDRMTRALHVMRDNGQRVEHAILGGGVTANTFLRQRADQWADEHELQLHLPSMDLCVDNAAMIAGLAHHQLAAGQVDDLSLAAHATGSV